MRPQLISSQAADCCAAETLRDGLVPSTLMMTDRAYDTNAERRQLEDQGAVPNIPLSAPSAGELLQSGTLGV